jgi:hypothetical protein
MDAKKQNNTIKTINSIFLKLLDILVKANYHEYPIMDKEGNIIGSEFVTAHGGLLFRPKIVTKDNNNSPSNCP